MKQITFRKISKNIIGAGKKVCFTIEDGQRLSVSLLWKMDTRVRLSDAGAVSGFRAHFGIAHGGRIRRRLTESRPVRQIGPQQREVNARAYG